MKKIELTSVEDINNIFSTESVEFTNSIRESLQEAIDSKKKSVCLFEIYIEGFDSVFEIILTKKEYITALENCLKLYEKWEMGDEALDTYLLIKQLKG
jgi:hypothetical protein